MHVVVCIKQVPDTADVKINPETNTLMRDGVKSIINPFDMYAIEEGIRIKEAYGGKVTVITMGPPQAEEALKEAVSMGVDDAILISDRAFAGSDTYATSYALSAAIEKIGDYDLILCGKQASDGDTAQVGPGIATHLDLPQATYVKKIVSLDEEKAVVERMTEEGYDVVELQMPCLFTVVKEINEPRVPSLRGKMKAKSFKVNVWTAKDLEADPEKIGLKGSPTQVVKIFTPQRSVETETITGESASEIAEQLAQKVESVLKG